MANIQFTFSRNDLDLVRFLKEGLETYGHKTILATDDVLPGKVFKNEMLFRLKSADFLIVVLSKNSVDSQNVILETSTAMGYYYERNKPFILPILLDDIPIPNFISTFKVLRATREEKQELILTISQAISQLIGKIEAIKEEQKENKANLEENAETYITESITRLEANEKNYRRLAYTFYSLCGVSLISTILLLVFKGNSILNSTAKISTSQQIQFGLLWFVLLALLISVSRYLFLIGKSFMVESLRNSDRIHAISFGKFYLKAYGAEAEPSEIKEAFQHWNIDGGSSFITQSATDFDPEIFKNIIEFTKVITTKK
ncbi:toll/interleukin-1 receptor domain-containing protein [Niallia taxi]|uniref:toll/interleukin-1 receptor domain-containing protein n=1 Tax=Niallia taxi TaxID=2499688 RepID=UPI002E1EA93D|nr:toll/interleukin-1 receptor domain-containing protein [Niallia taxi]